MLNINRINILNWKFSTDRSNRFSSTSLGKINEGNEEEESSSSSFPEAFLPNVDGADSSDDEPRNYGKVKQARKYKPLQFRPGPPKVARSKVESELDSGTSLNLQSPSSSLPSVTLSHSASSIHQRRMPKVDNSVNSNSRFECSEIHHVESRSTSAKRLEIETVEQPNHSEYSDALYSMSYLSPPPIESPESPPQPGTPMKNARITVRPLLQDISAFERSSGRKIKVNSGRVILKSLEEEIDSYQSQSHVRLRIDSSSSNRESPVSQEKSRKRQRIESDTVDEIEQVFQADETQMQEENQGDTVSSISEKEEFMCFSQIFVAKKEMSSKLSKNQTQSSGINRRSCGITQGTVKETKHTIDLQVCDTNSITGSEENEICMIDVDTPKKDEENIFHQPSQKETNLDHSLPQCQNSVLSNEGSESCDIPELPDSIHSLSQNLSRSSSSLQFTSHCDSSNSVIWNEDSSSFLDDRVKTVNKIEESTKLPQLSQTDQSIVIQPQVFNPSTIYATIFDGPSHKHVVSTLDLYDIPSADNGTPFWGDAKDLEPFAKTKDFRRQTLPICSKLICHLPDFGASNQQVILSTIVAFA